MPMFELTYPKGALNDNARGPLVEQLTGALMRWEGAPDTDFFRQATWGYLTSSPPGPSTAPGRPPPPRRSASPSPSPKAR